MVAALLPLLMDDGFLAVALYALLAGFAYVVFDGASQSLDLAMLPDVRSVGRSLAAYSLANTFGTILGRCLRRGDCGDRCHRADLRCRHCFDAVGGSADIAVEIATMTATMTVLDRQ